MLTACSSHDDTKSNTGGSSAGTPTTNTPGANNGGGNSGGGGGDGTTGTSRVALDVKSFCNKAVTTCGDNATSESDCEAMFAAVRVTQDCATALLNASCDDLAGGSGAVGSCFPSCTTPGATTCNGDGTLSVCGNASKALVYDCATTCTEVGKSGSGKCGTANDNSGNSGQKCLCN